MHRRITLLATLAALFSVLLLAIPLAVFAARGYVNDERLELQRAAATAAATVDGDQLHVDALRIDHSEITASIYNTSGRLMDGPGLAQGGQLVAAAAAGTESSTTSNSEIAVAAPVTDGDRVTAVIVLRTDLNAAHHRTLIAWLVIAAISTVAVLIAAMVARIVARRLTAPIDRLRTGAGRLGAGDLDARIPASGIDEFDTLAATLNDAATRIQTMLGRERSLSAEISHQLRTPLTGLRLELEALQQSHPNDVRFTDAGHSVDRLAATITDVIALARDLPGPQRSPVGELLIGVDQRWHGLLATATRPLRITAQPDLPEYISVSVEAATQILDILIDNSLTHGSGAVTVHARLVGRAVAIDVSDEGPALTQEPHELFAGRDDARAGGIGLPFARKLAQTEHARVTLASASPPTFSFIANCVDTAAVGTDTDSGPWP